MKIQQKRWGAARCGGDGALVGALGLLRAPEERRQDLDAATELTQDLRSVQPSARGARPQDEKEWQNTGTKIP